MLEHNKTNNEKNDATNHATLNWQTAMYLARVIFALSFVSFQVYTAATGLLAPLLQRSVHWAFATVLTFLVISSKGNKNYNKPDLLTIVCIFGSLFVGIYVILNHHNLWTSMGIYSRLEFFLAVIGLLLLLETVRRLIGIPLVFVVICALLYAYFGNLLPIAFAAPKFSFERIVTHSFYTMEGVFGIPLGVSASYIFLFILYAVILQKTGVGQLFIDMANSTVGHVRGGAAKISIVASGFFGMISGSSTANTAATGSFTIPLMKKTGYSSEYAGALECAASTAGQLTPPIMGAAAFIMAEIMNVPYWTIVRAALIPAILYYVAIFLAADLEALKRGVKGLPKDVEREPIQSILRRGWPFLLSPVILVVLLVVYKWSPMRSVFFALVVVAITYVIHDYLRNKLIYKTLLNLTDAMVLGARTALSTVIACAAVGVVIGVVGLTGIGLRFSSLLTSLAGGNMLILLFLTMIATLILGMGLPTVAAYMLLAILIVPTLIEMGVYPMSAHLFVFYFGIMSHLTPPVMISVFVASTIAEGNPLKTGWYAIKIAAVAFLIPYMFIYSPALLGSGPVTKIIIASLTALIGVIAICMSFHGYIVRSIGWLERSLLGLGSVCLIFTELYTDILGFILVGSILIWHFFIQARKISVRTEYK